MKRILIFLLLPIIAHAGQKNSKQKDLPVKIMVEILKKKVSGSSANGDHETLTYAYNTYDVKSGFGAEKKKPSDDLQYSVPVFMCSANDIDGIKTWRIVFQAIHNQNPRPEERIEEDLDTLMENDEEESSRRINESIKLGENALRAFRDPIAKDNREFSRDEHQIYQTPDPNIIVKAGVYTIDNQ